MSQVETLNGPKNTSELGFTLMHEHIFTHPEGLIQAFPTVWDEEKEIRNAQTKLKDLHKQGVDTIVDATILGLGRNIPLLLKLGHDSPVNIIVATGVYHWFDRNMNWLQFAKPGQTVYGNEHIDTIAALFLRDVQVGIQGTSVKAAIIKATSDTEGITPTLELYLRAAARAHRKTGRPIYTHSSSYTCEPVSGSGEAIPAEETAPGQFTCPEGYKKQGLRQLDILESEGVDLSRVVIGHAGDCEDIAYLTEMMDRGSLIGMDRFGLESPHPGYLATEKRIAALATLCKMGYADKMVLSHDGCFCETVIPIEYVVAEGNPDVNDLFFIIRDVIPALGKAGVSEDQITQMTQENPRRFFENTTAYC